MTEQENKPEGNLYVAKTIAGLEEVLAQELVSLGAADVQILKRAVSFSGDDRMLYKVNYSSRTALRVLVHLFTFQLADEDDLYRSIFDYPWEDLFEVTQTLSVDAVVSDSELTHSHYVALRTKDAVVDRFREHYNGRRPSVDTDDPDFRINIHINGSICDVSLDSSGASLHKRGYRVSNAEAPMSEVLAAGLILLSGWDKKSHFIDPMCGSGTLLIEAALIANNIPPGQYRKSFGFMRWKSFSQEIWDEIKAEALGQQVEFDHQIIGNDIAPKALSAARNNIKSARMHKDIHLVEGPFSALKPPEGEPGIVMINPPYGERIKTNNIIGLYKEIGDTLKNEFSGYKAWVISSDQYALKFVGLKPAKKYIVWNGPLECKFCGYDLYRGTRKEYPKESGNEVAEGEETVKYPLRREERDEEANRPAERDARPEYPYHRTERPERPYSREKREDRTDRPFKREDRPDRPFRRDDASGKPYDHEKREDGTARPFKREERPDRPFRRDDAPSKPFSREKREEGTRPFKREDRADRPFHREDSSVQDSGGLKQEGEAGIPVKREERPDKPFRKEERSARPSRNNERDEKPGRRSEHTDRSSGREKKEFKVVEEYLPQNRFEKPEKTYRREDGRVNEGKPSEKSEKPVKVPRPRKPRNDED